MANVWVKPSAGVEPFQTACYYKKVHGSGKIEGWSLYALIHTSGGWSVTPMTRIHFVFWSTREH